MFEYFIGDKREFLFGLPNVERVMDLFRLNVAFFGKIIPCVCAVCRECFFKISCLLIVCRESFFFCAWITVCSDQFKFGLLRESKSCVWKASVHFFEFWDNWCATRRVLVLILHRYSDLNVLKRVLALCVHRYSDLNKMISMFGNILSGMQEKFLFWLRDEESLIFLCLPKKGAMSLTLFFGWAVLVARSRLAGCLLLWTILFWSCPIMDSGRTACAETFLISTLHL